MRYYYAPTHTHTHSNTHTHIHNILRQYLLYIDGHIQYVYLFCTLYTVQCVFPLISYILFIFYFQLFITGILICNLFNDSLRRGGAQLTQSLHQVWELSMETRFNWPVSPHIYRHFVFVFELLTHLVRQAEGTDKIMRDKAITSKNCRSEGGSL